MSMLKFERAIRIFLVLVFPNATKNWNESVLKLKVKTEKQSHAHDSLALREREQGSQRAQDLPGRLQGAQDNVEAIFGTRRMHFWSRKWQKFDDDFPDF